MAPLAPARGAGLWSRPYLVLTLTALMWAGNAVASRLAVGEVSPLALTALRWIIALAVLAVVARRDLVAAWPELRPRWVSLAVFGTMGFTAFNALFYLAAHHTTAVNLGIIQGAIPVVVLIGALVAFRTPIRPLQAAGVAITLVGVAVVAARGDPRVLATLQVNPGDAYILVAAVLYAFYTLGLRNRPPVSGLALFAAMAIAACVTSLPLAAYEAAVGDFQWPTLKGWAILLYIGLFPSLLSQVLFIRGVELIGPGRAGLFVNLVPVFAALLAVAILGEPFRWYHGLALALVLGGIWLAERRR